MLEFEERGLMWGEAEITFQNRYQLASFSEGPLFHRE